MNFDGVGLTKIIRRAVKPDTVEIDEFALVSDFFAVEELPHDRDDFAHCF